MTESLGQFWTSVLSTTIEHIRPRATLLVGGGDGTLLMQLLDRTVAMDGLLHVADPMPAFDTKAARKQGGDSLVLHQAPGRDVARLLAAPDLLLLNGDANFYSVHSVLHAVRDQADRQHRLFPLTLAGNTAWPYGRRDYYPDPHSIPENYRRPFVQAGLQPDRADPCISGGLFADRNHATLENEPSNGVLTALEEFVLSQSSTLGLVTMPVWHGLGVIYRLADRHEGACALLAAIAMGAGARHEATQASLALWTAKAELAESRRAGEAARGHIDRLSEALRREQMHAANLRGTPAVPYLAAAGQAAGERASTAASLNGLTAGSAENTAAQEIALLRASPIMDGAWYLWHYADVAEGGVDPVAHYYQDGAREGRDPGPDFSTSFYLEQNSDLAGSGHNPLLHYLRSGAADGRNPSPHFDSRYYVDSNPDVAEAGHNPLEHYLKSGRAEGRRPLPRS